MTERLLRASGQHGVFLKSQSPDVEPLELLWLEPGTSLETALPYAEDRRTFGLAEKGATGLLALRFRDPAILSTYAQEKRLQTPPYWKMERYGIPRRQ